MAGESKIITGSEKNVRFVRDEAWAINRKSLDGQSLERRPEWIEASFLLGEIAHALLPDQFVKPISLEFLVKDALEGLEKNALRRTKKSCW